jgi:hypothetical protein
MSVKRIVVAILLVVSLYAQAERPERKVEHNVIVSQHDPAVRIELPKSARYLGADRWVLYGIADCELHAFVETDKQKQVQQLYWIQFEGYLPSKPDLHHQYDSPTHATIGGLDFFVDTWVRGNDEKMDPGSDREHIDTMVHNKGFIMPSGMMYVRLVHLLDDQKRKELMIIYGEDLAPTGLTAADLAKNGKAYDQWPALQKSLLELAQQKIKLDPLAKP